MALDRFKPSRHSLGVFAAVGAWFFIVVSLLHVSWAIAVMWGDPSGPTKLYHTVVGGVSYDAWGLTYTGILGLLFAIVQLLVVSSAAVTSLLPFDRTLKARRAAHLVLCGWSALWVLNLVRLAAIDSQIDSVAQAALLSVLFGCTLWRASSAWSPRRLKPTAEPPALDVPVIDDAPAVDDAPAADDAEKESFSALVAVALGKLVRFVQTALRWVLAAPQRMRRGGRVARRKAAGGLNRVADFARKQASRVAPNTGE